MDDDDAPRRKKEYPLSTAKLSKTPSWIMLGFVLGALFVIALPPLGKKSTPPAGPPRKVEFVNRAPREPQPLMMIEAVFAEWGHHAVWSEGTTEVALWNIEQKAFTDFYEVRRFGGTFYFRTITGLTRRILTHGVPRAKSPLQFTETEEQYREWLEHAKSDDDGVRSKGQ